MKTPSSRSTVLGVALLLSLAASVWTYSQRAADPALATALPVEAARRAQAAAASAAPPAGTAPEPRATARAQPVDGGDALAAVPVVNLFAAVDWSAPPPAPAAPQTPPPPAAPQAPALPFEYLGKTEVVGPGSAVVVHLRRGQELVSVREGGAIDDQYKLEKIGPDSIEIAYLPLAVIQTLSIGTK